MYETKRSRALDVDFLILKYPSFRTPTDLARYFFGLARIYRA